MPVLGSVPLRSGVASVMPTLDRGLRSVGGLRLTVVVASDCSLAHRSEYATCDRKTRSGLWSLREVLRE